MNQAATFGSTRPIIPAGTQLNGIYEIDEPIAAGGMGEIYKGHAIQTGDIVAIKLIRSDLAEAEAAFALFRKEASALHNLYHEAIVRYYVFTVDPVLERPYLAMEYVDGQSLSTMLRGGPLAFEAVQRLMRRIAAGLHAAHERGIIHRDVSPDNIIIPGGDMARAKIIDFGIARSTRLEDEGTVIGAGFAGKYNYVSPEQLGLFGGHITPKSDIYSLGLVLAEALRNGPIDMGGNHVDVIEKRRSVPELGPVDERLRPLIEHMLQPNPDDRPASMAEVAAWRADAPAVKRPARPRAPPPQPAKAATFRPLSGRTLAMLGGAAAAAALAAATPFVYSSLRPTVSVAPPPPILQGEPSGSRDKTPLSGDTASLRPSSPAGSPSFSPPGADSAVAPLDAAPSKPGLAPMNLAKLDPDLPASAALGETAETAGRDRQAVVDALAKAAGDFDGGDCAFARPVVLADNSPAIEGLGLTTAPFRGLDQSFREANGYEADIGVRLVSQPQCPAVAFLNQVRNTPGPPLKLELAPPSVRAGQPVAGAISGADGRDVGVLVIADDGAARTIATTRAARGDALTFNARPPDLGAGKLQLVVAVAAPEALASLRPGQTGPAAKVFAQILSEAKKSGASLMAAARSFKADK